MKNLGHFLSLIIFLTAILPAFAEASSGDCANCSPRRTSRPASPSTVLRVCQTTVANECSDIPENKRVSCSESLNPNIFRTNINTMVGCATGALRAAGDFLEFLYEIAKFLIMGLVRAGVGLGQAQLAFLKDPSGFLQRAGSGVQRFSRAQIMSFSQLAGYLKREYEVESRRVGQIHAIGAVVNKVFSPILRTIVTAVQGFVAAQVHKFDCYDEAAKSEMVCRAIGQFLIPPAGIIALMRGGGRALLTQFPRMKRALDGMTARIAADLRATRAARAASNARRAQAPVPVPVPSIPAALLRSLERQRLSPALMEVLTKDEILARAVVNNPTGLRYLAITVSEQRTLSRQIASTPQARSNFIEVMRGTRGLNVSAANVGRVSASMKRYVGQRTRNFCPL